METQTREASVFLHFAVNEEGQTYVTGRGMIFTKSQNLLLIIIMPIYTHLPNYLNIEDFRYFLEFGSYDRADIADKDSSTQLHLLSIHDIYYQFITFTISSLQFTTGPQKFWFVLVSKFFSALTIFLILDVQTFTTAINARNTLKVNVHYAR